MKVIPLSEAQANLSQYARDCHDEPVIVTVNGVPSFQLVPFSEDDDLIDNLLENSPAFCETLRARVDESTISTEDARRRL
jgi:prevent-host-death family protein